jgi:hypothetical protein
MLSSLRGLDGQEKWLNLNTKNTRIPSLYYGGVILRRLLAVYGPERIDIGRSYAYWVLEPGYRESPRVI